MSQPDDPRNGGALRTGTRLVVRAGQPTAEELAAVVAALDATGDSTVDRAAQHRADRPPAWQRAARLEGAGLGGLATPADLERASQPEPGWP